MKSIFLATLLSFVATAPASISLTDPGQDVFDFTADAAELSGMAWLTFNRNVANTDLILTVQAADSLDGPWTELAQSVDDTPMTARHCGVTVTETGTGATRGVAVRDLFPLGDPAHPRRFRRVKTSWP